MRKRDFRRIGFAADHRFSEKRAPEREAVEPADQLAVEPGFDRMRLTPRVQGGDSAFDLVIDPGVAAIFDALGAELYDRFEREVRGRHKLLGKQRLLETARQVKTVEREDRARLGLDPVDRPRIATVRHRKNADGVGAQQQLGIERGDVARHYP